MKPQGKRRSETPHYRKSVYIIKNYRTELMLITNSYAANTCRQITDKSCDTAGGNPYRPLVVLLVETSNNGVMNFQTTVAIIQ